MEMATLQAERIGDVEEGENLAPPGEVDELGLTPDERAQFDGMKDADRGIGEGPEEAEEVSEELAPSTPPSPGVEAPAPAEAEELRKQAEEGRINHAKLAERLAILNDALTAPQAPRQLTPQEQEYQRQQEIQQNPMLEETIDPSVDIAGALAQMQRRQVFMAQASMYQQETTQEAMAHEAMVRDFTRDTQMFSQTEEGQHFFGMDGAYQHLKNTRLVELGLALFDKDPSDPKETFTQAEIDKMVEDFNTEEAWVVQNALQGGKSPAKAIMKLAKGRGWKAPQVQTSTPAPVVQPQVRKA